MKKPIFGSIIITDVKTYQRALLWIILGTGFLNFIDQACVHDGKRRYGELRGKKVGCLFVLQLSQSSDGGSDRGGGGSGIVPGST